MDKGFRAESTIQIHASASKVWEALTNPKLIKQYLFGTDVVTDWKVGSPIAYKGVWEGKPFEDKGRILQIEPQRLLVSTYWSAFSGMPDSPENYQTVRYELHPEGGAKTSVTITQDNNPTEEAAARVKQNWHMTLESMKKVVESL